MFKKNKKLSAGTSRAQAILWIVATSFLLIIICTALWMYFWQGLYS